MAYEIQVGSFKILQITACLKAREESTAILHLAQGLPLCTFAVLKCLYTALLSE